jgi:hypothetical protein
MKGAIVHAVLLVAMLGFAYQTWTRDTSVKENTGKIVVWNEKAGDLQAIVHETADRTIKLERKGEGTASYFWGTDTKVTRKPKKKEPPPPLADGGVPPAPETPEPPEMETTTTVREFPAGEAVTPLVTGYAAMRAIRDLGVLSDDQKRDYELLESEKTITAVFASGPRSLVLGDKVLGGKDRYVMDVESGHGYVIAGSLIEPLEGGERSLQPKSVIPTGDDVVAIEITAGDRSKKVSRITATDEAGKQIKTWGDSATQKADQTTANFLEKIQTQIRPQKYDPALDPATMTKLVTVTYRDAKGGVLGTLDLYKQAGDAAEYFIVSERTRVPGQVSKTAGDQVEQNIATVFQ